MRCEGSLREGALWKRSSSLIKKKKKEVDKECGDFKICVQILQYSSHQNIKPNSLPLECELNLVTHLQ